MSDWEPDAHGINMGFMQQDGSFVGSPDAPRPHTLSHHKNPVLQRIGEFCDAAPPNVPTNIASFGGVLLGLRLAQTNPEILDQLIEDILRDRGSTEPLDDVVDMIANGG